MVARSRSRSFAGQIGSKTVNLNHPTSEATFTDSAWSRFTESCDDVTGLPWIDHGFNLSRVEIDVIPFNGIHFMPALPLNGARWVNYVGTLKSHGIASHLTLPSSPSNASLATLTLSRTNPSRADISIPNFLHELKDLPAMYRDIMAIKLRLRNIRYWSSPEKMAANYYLAGVMGWKPLISDLRKMMQFQSRVDKRVKELRRLYSGKGMTRKLRRNLDNATAADQTANLQVESSTGITLRCSKSVITKRTTWTSVRWRPTVVPKDLSDVRLRKIAYGLVFGINFQPKYVWDALPWSWMVDWFTNIGDYVNSHSWVVPATSSVPLIMRTTETRVELVRIDTNNHITGGSAVGRRVTKTRTAAGAALSATLPFLSGGQLSILSALVIQRKR
jgi:hypothetical protein